AQGAGLHVQCQRARGRGDVLAASVAGRDHQLQPVIARRQPFGRIHPGLDGLAEAPALADESDAGPAPVQFGDLAVQRIHEELHQGPGLCARTAPVLAGEGEQGQCPDAALKTEVDADVDRACAGAMADGAGPPALFRPAAVAVHDDGQVAGNACVRIHRQTAINSCSLALTTSSTSLMALSVDFWISSSLRCTSSSVTCLSFSSSRTWWLASRRMLRIAIFASSPAAWTCLDSSLRRSSVSAGM